MYENTVHTTGAGIAASYPYGSSAPERPSEAAPAPLDAQMSMLLGVLMELRQLVERLEPPRDLKAIPTEKFGQPEGLTALTATCLSEAGSLGLALRSIAERIGRL